MNLRPQHHSSFPCAASRHSLGIQVQNIKPVFSHDEKAAQPRKCEVSELFSELLCRKNYLFFVIVFDLECRIHNLRRFGKTLNQSDVS